jgi:hypothetical protein
MASGLYYIYCRILNSKLFVTQLLRINLKLCVVMASDLARLILKQHQYD